MTGEEREEAIKFFKGVAKRGRGKFSKLAIEALEAQRWMSEIEMDREREETLTDIFAEICVSIQNVCNKYEVSHVETLYMINKGLEHIWYKNLIKQRSNEDGDLK